MFWKNTFLDDVKKYISGQAAKLQYFADKKWSNAKIIDKKIKNDKILLSAVIEASGAFTVEGIRLVNAENVVIAEAAEKLTKNSDVFSIRLEIPLIEEDIK